VKNARDMTTAFRPTVTERLMRYLSDGGFQLNSRLPAERKLAEELGVTRASLRAALAILESEGRIWRHVGRGTFIGSHPIEPAGDAEGISNRTTPRELIEARLLIEPGLVGLAAMHASRSDIENMARCIQKTKSASDWRVYETWDDKLHQAFAEAAHNAPLMAVFNLLNTIRRSVVWARPRDIPFVRKFDHHSFGEHDRIFEAITERNAPVAEQMMRDHLESVGANLMRAMGRADRPFGATGTLAHTMG